LAYMRCLCLFGCYKERGRLRWMGYVSRKDETNWARRGMDMGSRLRGRPRKTGINVVVGLARLTSAFAEKSASKPFMLFCLWFAYGIRSCCGIICVCNLSVIVCFSLLCAMFSCRWHWLWRLRLPTTSVEYSMLSLTCSKLQFHLFLKYSRSVVWLLIVFTYPWQLSCGDKSQCKVWKA